MAGIDSCNVLEQDRDSRRLWRFSAGGGQVKKSSEFSGLPSDPLPRKQFTKGWSSLWHKSVNIAWLPPDQVFLAAVKTPKTDSDEELRTMIEFQLERLSPLPLAHIVWSFEKAPQNPKMLDELRTSIVVIASRSAVEKRLGEFEGDGYQPDRLEVPFLHQLLTMPIHNDGVWVFPFTVQDRTFCLTAWWYHKTLNSVSLVNLTTRENWGGEILDELNKVAWAGEVEGWITSDPKVHLVCDDEAAEIWQPLLAEACGTEVERSAPPARQELAALNARRVARGESVANLLPAERALRYRQELTDRIWMRAVGAMIVVYLIGVACYFGWLQYLGIQKMEVDNQIAALTGDYDKVLEMRAQIEIQQQQIGLRYAALDAWKAVAETLPGDLTLTAFDFSRGERVRLVGSASNNQGVKVTDFNEDLGKYTLNGRPLFSEVGPASIRSANGVAQWNFDCILAQ